MANEQEQWYKKSISVWLGLIFFPPLGIILLYINRSRYPKWKAMSAIAVLWALIIIVPKNHKNPPPSSHQPQTKVQTSAPEQKQPTVKKEQIYNIGLTNDDFDARFADISQQMIGTRIDLTHGSFSAGEKRDVLSLNTNDGVILQKWINKDKTLNAFLAISDTDKNSINALVIYMGMGITALQPNISVDDRKTVLNKLITPQEGKQEFTNKAIYGDISYTLTLSKQTGLIFTASNKNE